jgi:hypothetical protein
MVSCAKDAFAITEKKIVIRVLEILMIYWR